MCLVAEDGTLVRGTATGPRSPKALVSIRDLMWSVACSLCAQWSLGMVMSCSILKKTLPRFFSFTFCSRGHCMIFFNPHTDLVLPQCLPGKQVCDLSLDDSYFSFYPACPVAKQGGSPGYSPFGVDP